MPAHSWAPRPSTEVSQLRPCHLPSEQRRLNPSFLPVYLMVLSQHKATLYLLNYQISAQRTPTQPRSVSQEQSPTETRRDSSGESSTPIPMLPTGRSRWLRALPSEFLRLTRTGPASRPQRGWQSRSSGTNVLMVTGAAREGFARREGQRFLPRSWAAALSRGLAILG